MRKRHVVSSFQMKQLDFLTMEKKGISSLELMQQAGKCMEEYLVKNGLASKDDEILIVAGIGNNGGDSLVIAQLLHNKGITYKVVMVGEEKNQSEQSKIVFNQLLQQDVEMYRVDAIEQLETVIPLFVSATLIIDGMFGIGLTREVKGYHKGIISMMNHSKGKVISIDIPSGINADNGLVCGIAVQANHTLIVQHYKQGNLLSDAQDYSGEIHMIDVGIVTPDVSTDFYLRDCMISKLEPRKHNTHKYHYGYVFVVGGSKGMMGAPLLSGYSALRMGSGLSKVLYNDKYLSHIQNPYPPVMVDTYEDILEIDLSKASAIVFGPGLGRNDESAYDILKYLLQLKVPIVIDADGIYYLKEIIDEVKLHKNIVITPHYGEMAMFLDTISPHIQKDPTKYAKDVSENYGITVLLKGNTTIITNNEETYYSTHGNPGMATAGSGDVLTGIIGSLLGRKYTPMEACTMGVSIHGNAADLASLYLGEESLIATDIIEYIPEILKK